MFYPFVAPMAQKETDKTRKVLEAERETLTDAYLAIAHVYIHRAASRGGYQTSVFCPYEICRNFVTRLQEGGFEVEKNKNIPNRYLVSWVRE